MSQCAQSFFDQHFTTALSVHYFYYNQYSPYTRVMWKLVASSAQTLRMNKR